MCREVLIFKMNELKVQAYDLEKDIEYYKNELLSLNNKIDALEIELIELDNSTETTEPELLNG